MNFGKRIGLAWVLLAGMVVGGVATATPITMDFNGLTPLTAVGNYYNGGCTTLLGFDVNCGGSNYGVVWQGAVVGDDSATLVFDTRSIMNIATGFGGSLSFDYYNYRRGGSVAVFTGLDGSGTQLAYADLDKSKDWDSFSLVFSGVAHSMIFTGSRVFLSGFDVVTLGDAPVQQVPEPAALGVFGLGLLLMGAFAGLRRRYN